MPLDQLLSALEREARAAADQLLADADAEAARLLHDADDAIASRRARSVATRVAALRAAMEHAVAEAGREARGGVLRARDHLVARIFTALRAALPGALERDDYRAALPGEVRAALDCIAPEEAAVLRCTPLLLSPIRAMTREQAGITVEPDADLGNGFRLATADGAVEVDATLESRLGALATPLARAALVGLERAG